MRRFSAAAALIGAMALQACTAPATGTATPIATTTVVAPGVTPPPADAVVTPVAVAPANQTFLFSWGMFADPVFDRDVVTFERAFARAYGTPVDADTFGFTGSTLEEPNITVMQTELAQMAADAVDGRDTVVVMLTSHGSPDVMAIKTEPNGPVSGVSAEGLAEFLAPLAADRQILILQACFSGSLIDELRSPNRIILTAAAADRSSFGCNPESDNTWFIKALNRAMVEVGARGGSWKQVFERTRALVAADEAAQGVPPSNPQSSVGANMRDLWLNTRL
ncbi:C13 family peptidase [Pseudooctadecabacter jejudonensis]|uniref:Peptidase C13 family protein n=1 Tax=Pseudooctadecabacter jejudonensis TaxID=1391910 RepID=A0A1Y5SL20_9RHOB|nr:C13 family peptidase [Pseudooctadecabacter jejudonensis]SLN40127.1 Peptidase C13 family protein [Pseudooctadecabacter jejudonensis]